MDCIFSEQDFVRVVFAVQRFALLLYNYSNIAFMIFKIKILLELVKYKANSVIKDSLFLVISKSFPSILGTETISVTVCRNYQSFPHYLHGLLELSVLPLKSAFIPFR